MTRPTSAPADDPVLDAIAAWEPHLRAFVSLDPASRGGPGPLSGVTVGVKDIVDVAGWPTRNGSATCADAAPAARDARAVAALRAAGRAAAPARRSGRGCSIWRSAPRPPVRSAGRRPIAVE